MKTQNFILAAALAVLPLAAFAQQRPAEPELEFTVVKENPITSVKDQHRTGTCWCFAGISFLESEAIRLNNLQPDQYPDFSEMFVVGYSYKDRAEKYVYMDGHIRFAPGSQSEDVLTIMEKDGLVPNSVMPGLNYGTTLPVHGELDATTKAYVEAIEKDPNKGLTPVWKKGFAAIVDTYLGVPPTEFEHNGKTYTPASYRDSYKLVKDDYVSLTSFTHHPFYKAFDVELPDNWRGESSYNIPIDELWEIMYNAQMNGYTFTWGGDISEVGFTRNGLGLLLDTKAAQTSGSDQERWVGKDTKKGKKEEVKPAEAPKELAVTQESRQAEFEARKTTDDHGMHAFGIAKDQFGNTYLLIKNSWGDSGKYHGIWYMSEAFAKCKVNSIIVHKDAIPAALKEKLNIK